MSWNEPEDAGLTPVQRRARRAWLAESRRRERELQAIADESMEAPDGRVGLPNLVTDPWR